MSFNQFSAPSPSSSYEPSTQKPSVAKTSSGGGFMLTSLKSSQPVVSLSNSILPLSTTASSGRSNSNNSNNTNHNSNSNDLIDYLSQLDSPSSSPSKRKLNMGNNFPTLDSLINDDLASNTGKKNNNARELISAMTYEGEGTLLDEGSDSDSGSNASDSDDEVAQGLIQEKAASIPPPSTDLKEVETPIPSSSSLKLTKEKEVTALLDLNETTMEEEAQQEQQNKEDQADDEYDQSVVDSTPAKPNDSVKKNDNESIATTASSKKIECLNPPTSNKKQVVFDFQKFLKLFKNKQCDPIHKYLKSFLVQFGQKSWTVDEQVKLVKDFQNFIYDKLLQYPPFNTITDELELDNCKEGLEKLIMTRIYNQVFTPAITPRSKLSEQHKEDIDNDKKYHTNVKLFDWVTLKHLDVPMSLNVESNFIKLASTELNKMNNYKSPRDKIICILNCCKIIFGLIRQQQKLHRIEENADSFVPLLIYVLLQAKPKYLYSNLLYIERFRTEEFLVGETSYYVSTLQIACNFIIEISIEKLTISKEVYESEITAAKKKLQEEQEAKKQLKLQQQQLQQQELPDRLLSPIPKKITDLIGSSTTESPSQVLTKSAELVKQSLSNSLTNFFQPTSPSPTSTPAKKFKKELSPTASTIEEIKNLSISEHERELAIKKQREENFEVLITMFPNLDKELINDVVIMKSSEGEGDTAERSIGACVDALLALSG